MKKKLLSSEEIKQMRTGIIGLLLSIIPILLFVFCYIKSNGSFSSEDSGIVWICFYGYYFLGFIPVGIAFRYNAKTLKTKWKAMGVIGFVLLFLPVILIYYTNK